MKHMTFPEAIKSAFRNYANFRGRARRSEFWYFYLLNFIINFTARIIVSLPLIFSLASEGGETVTPVSLTGTFTVFMGLALLVINLVLAIPSISVSVRRLHDTGSSGWYLLVGLIPMIGAVMMLFWFCQDSQPDANKWGKNPKE